MLAKYIMVSSANLITFDVQDTQKKALKLIKNKSEPKMNPCDFSETVLYRNLRLAGGEAGSR